MALLHLARLEGEAGQSLGEVGHVLAGAAADLQHKARGRQYAGEHLEDRLLVALGGGGGFSLGHGVRVRRNWAPGHCADWRAGATRVLVPAAPGVTSYVHDPHILYAKTSLVGISMGRYHC